MSIFFAERPLAKRLLVPHPNAERPFSDSQLSAEILLLVQDLLKMINKLFLF